MFLPKFCLLAVYTYSFAAAIGVAADPAPSALKDPAEQEAWATIAARFTSAPNVKADSAKTTEIAVSGLKDDPKGGNATASITIDKATGRVTQVTSNGAKFTDAEFASFAEFPDLGNITLWHNSGEGFKGTGLERGEAAEAQSTDAGGREL
jgi:hypothetical protein